MFTVFNTVMEHCGIKEGGGTLGFCSGQAHSRDQKLKPRAMNRPSPTQEAMFLIRKKTLKFSINVALSDGQHFEWNSAEVENYSH